jgi:hypothetical protein
MAPPTGCRSPVGLRQQAESLVDREQGRQTGGCGEPPTGMDLRAHHERRRHSVIGILALIAQVDSVARHTRCQALCFGGSRNRVEALVPPQPFQHRLVANDRS